jgi:hypothetical protein
VTAKKTKAHLERWASAHPEKGDFDGRIIFNGFTTAKNFSDWILRFRALVRQAKNRAEVIHSLNPSNQVGWQVR